jgi:hypothetical protein
MEWWGQWWRTDNLSFLPQWHHHHRPRHPPLRSIEREEGLYQSLLHPLPPPSSGNRAESPSRRLNLVLKANQISESTHLYDRERASHGSLGSLSPTKLLQTVIHSVHQLIHPEEEWLCVHGLKFLLLLLHQKKSGHRWTLWITVEVYWRRHSPL